MTSPPRLTCERCNIVMRHVEREPDGTETVVDGKLHIVKNVAFTIYPSDIDPDACDACGDLIIDGCESHLSAIARARGKENT